MNSYGIKVKSFFDKNSVWDKGLFSILCILLLLVLATLSWAMPRGLGLGDEGVYLLSARYPEEIVENVSAVYIYTGWLFRLMQYDPVAFRFIGVVLVLISSAVLSVGVIKLSEHFGLTRLTGPRAALTVIFLALGAMLYYQWFFATPNNYTITAAALNIFLGTLLCGICSLETSRLSWGPVLAGVAAGLAGFIKFTTGIGFIFVGCAALLLWPTASRRAGLKAMALFIFGVLLWTTIHFIFASSPDDTWRSFIAGWNLYQSFGAYNPSNKLAMYSTELVGMVTTAISVFAWSQGIAFSLIATQLIKHVPTTVATPAIFVAIVLAIGKSILVGVDISLREAPTGIIPFYLVFPFAWVFLFLTLSAFEVMRSRDTLTRVTMRRWIVAVGLLLACPILASIGTANYIYNVTGFYSTPWFAAILILAAFSLNTNLAGAHLQRLSMLLIGAIATNQIVQGIIVKPQQLPTDLPRQTQISTVGYPEKEMLLDLQTSELVGRIRATLNKNGLQPGGDIIAFSYIPGIVYAVGGRSPGHPTFLSGSAQADAYSSIALGFASTERLRRAFIVLNEAPEEPAKLLATQGIQFPGTYRLLDSFEYVSAYGARSTFTLWKPEQ